MSSFRHSTALLVIDAQASFTARPYFDPADLPAYLEAQNRLIDGFIEAGLPVVRVFHVEPEGVFHRASGWVRPIEGLREFAPDLQFDKQWHSAFAGSPLAGWLTQRGIGRLVVSGIRSEQCCETTTRDASDRGFEVDYVTAATLTFAMRHRGGRVFSAEEIKQRCELVLDGRFARVCTVDEALAAAGPLHRQAA